MTTVFVLGLFDTGLAVVRALGRNGIPVRGFDYRGSNFGFKSRYGTHMVCPNPTTEEDAAIEFLREQARIAGPPVYVMPSSDAFLLMVSRRREDLAGLFEWVLPPKETVEDVVDKRRQYARARDIGIPVPETHYPSSLDEVDALSLRLDYPVMVKPEVGHLWREQFKKNKGVRIEDRESLLALYREIFAAGMFAMVQSLILGPNTNHYKLSAFMDGNNEPVAAICLRKLRQFPIDFGVGCLMESIRDEEVEALGLRFLRGLQWRGTGSVEFKRDDRDGQLRLIELNPRLWQQNALAEACGLNFPWIQYEMMCGRRPRPGPYRVGVKWLDEFRDPQSAWRHHQAGLLTLGGYLNSLRGIGCFALWARDDLGPFKAALADYGRGALRRLTGRRRAAQN